MSDRDDPPSKPTVKIPAAPRVPRPPGRGVVVEQNLATRHRDASIEAARQKSDADLEQKSTLGAVIAHSERQDRVNDAQNRAMVIIARELGVEDKLDPLLTQSLPPRAGGTPKAKPVLGQLDRRSRSQQIVQVIVALGVIAEVVRSAIQHWGSP